MRRFVVSGLANACALLAMAAPATASPAPTAGRASTPIPPTCHGYVLVGQLYVTCTAPSLVRATYFNAPPRDFCITGFTSIGSITFLSGYGVIGTC
jgi:hypothetical protein